MGACIRAKVEAYSLHCPMPSEYFPAVHAVHTLAPSAETEPEAQLAQVPTPAWLLRLLASWPLYLPEAQFVHHPVESEYLPAAHVLQLVAEVALFPSCPAGQLLHVVAPEAANLPAAHTSQLPPLEFADPAPQVWQ